MLSSDCQTSVQGAGKAICGPPHRLQPCSAPPFLQYHSSCFGSHHGWLLSACFPFPHSWAQLGWGGAPSLCACVGGTGGSQDPVWLAWGSRGGDGAAASQRGLPARPSGKVPVHLVCCAGAIFSGLRSASTGPPEMPALAPSLKHLCPIDS